MSHGGRAGPQIEFEILQLEIRSENSAGIYRKGVDDVQTLLHPFLECVKRQLRFKAGHLWWGISQYPSSCDPVRWGKSAAGTRLGREGLERILFAQHTRARTFFKSLWAGAVLPKKPTFPQKWESAKGWFEALGASPTGCSISSLSGCWDTVPSCDFCPGLFWVVASEGTEETQPFPAGKEFFLCHNKSNNTNNNVNDGPNSCLQTFPPVPSC